MSSRVETAVSFSLHEFSLHGGKTNTHCDGWGLANYRGKKAEVYREVEPAAFSKKMSFIQTHPYQTRCVISHIRRATVGDKALRNTQPFVRHINGRSHVFAHNGELAGIENKLMLNGCVLEGETDSERRRCYRSHRFGDGDYLFAFANKRKQKSGCVEPPGMYFLNRQCCCDRESLKYSGVEIFCEPQQLFLFASVPLTDEPWQPLPACQLLVVENGDLKAPNL